MQESIEAFSDFSPDSASPSPKKKKKKAKKSADKDESASKPKQDSTQQQQPSSSQSSPPTRSGQACQNYKFLLVILKVHAGHLASVFRCCSS